MIIAIENCTLHWYCHPGTARIYYQKHVATIETMSEVSDRIIAYLSEQIKA